MKKFICFSLCLVLLLSAVAALAVSAEEAAAPAHPIDRSLVYKAAYGTPTVDGVMDDIYLQSDVMYAENAMFGGSATVKEGQTATAEYRIVWDKTTLYIFCTVTDPTRSNPGAVGDSATKMDNTDIYVRLDPTFSIDGDYADRKTNEGSGQFRYNPNCTEAEEPMRKDWGKLTSRNQMAGTLHYVGGYLDETSGSYSFEMSFSYNPDFKAAIAENIKSRTETAIGFGLQINDVMDNDAKRDALIFSNNARKDMSSNLKNCGKVLLAYQEGLEIPEETTEATTEKPTEVPTKKPTETPTEKPTEKPTEAPTEKPTSPVSDTEPKPQETSGSTSDKPGTGCSSRVMPSLAILAIFGAAGAVGFAVRKKH